MKLLYILILIQLLLIGCCNYPFHGYDEKTGQIKENPLWYPHPDWWFGINGVWPHKPIFILPLTKNEEKEYFENKR